MATSNLNTGTASGAQSATQSPQISVGADGLGGGESSIQPTTAGSALTSSIGVPLNSSNLQSVTLTNGTPAQTSSSQSAHHAINPFLLVISILFFVVAVALFASTSRSAKTTTN